MAEIVADIAIHRRISCYSVGLKMLCLVGVNLEDLVGNYPLCTMAPIYLLYSFQQIADKMGGGATKGGVLNSARSS